MSAESPVQELIAKLRKISVCVYLAAEKSVARDISEAVKDAAARLEALAEARRGEAERIAEIRQRVNAYQKGGWSFVPPDSRAWDGFVPVSRALFAHAVNDIPFLLDALEQEAVARAQAEQERDTLQREVERLREAVAKYATHDGNCGVWGYSGYKDDVSASDCTCGLEAALSPGSSPSSETKK